MRDESVWPMNREKSFNQVHQWNVDDVDWNEYRHLSSRKSLNIKPVEMGDIGRNTT